MCRLPHKARTVKPSPLYIGKISVTNPATESWHTSLDDTVWLCMIAVKTDIYLKQINLWLLSLTCYCTNDLDHIPLYDTHNCLADIEYTRYWCRENTHSKFDICQVWLTNNEPIKPSFPQCMWNFFLHLHFFSVMGHMSPHTSHMLLGSECYNSETGTA